MRRRAEGKKKITSKRILKDLKKKRMPYPKMSDNDLIAKLKDIYG